MTQLYVSRKFAQMWYIKDPLILMESSINLTISDLLIQKLPQITEHYVRVVFAINAPDL